MDEEELKTLETVQEQLTDISEQLNDIIQAKKIADTIDRIVRSINDLIDQETSDEEADDSWC